MLLVVFGFSSVATAETFPSDIFAPPTIAPTPTPTATPYSFTIGAVLSLTGEHKGKAQRVRGALEFAVAEINEAGGIKGEPVSLQVKDGKSDPAIASRALQELVASGVEVTIGDVAPSVSAEMAKMAVAQRSLLLSPTVPDGWAEGNLWSFGLLPSPADSAAAVKTFLERTNPPSGAILCLSDNEGVAYADLWAEALEKHGATLTEQLCAPAGKRDLRIDLQRLKSSDPAMLFTTDDVESVLHWMHELEMKAKIFTTVDFRDAQSIRKLSVKQLEGVSFADWAINKEFSERYRARLKRYPLMEEVAAYDAVRVVAKVAREFDGPLATGLRNVKLEGGICPLDFSTQRPCSAKATLRTVREGRLK